MNQEKKRDRCNYSIHRLRSVWLSSLQSSQSREPPASTTRRPSKTSLCICKRCEQRAEKGIIDPLLQATSVSTTVFVTQHYAILLQLKPATAAAKQLNQRKPASRHCFISPTPPRAKRCTKVRCRDSGNSLLALAHYEMNQVTTPFAALCYEGITYRYVFLSPWTVQYLIPASMRDLVGVVAQRHHARTL